MYCEERIKKLDISINFKI